MTRKTRLDIFWMGKRRKTRLATEEWLRGWRTGKPRSQNIIASEYGVYPATINDTARKLEEEGLLEKHYGVVRSKARSNRGA